MAHPDVHVSALVDQHIAQHVANQHNRTGDADDDADALFASLEEEDDSAFRAARAQQLSDELKKHKPNSGAGREIAGHAQLVQTLRSDDELLRFTTENEKTVVHFLHAEFARCGIMDRHLDVVAKVQGSFDDGSGERARFGRVDVKEAQFVVEKLGIRVLPCVVGFKDGVAVGRIVGFDGLVWGGKEDGKAVTQSLESKLVEWKLLGRALVRRGDADVESDSDGEQEFGKSGRRGIRNTKTKANEADDDDWD